MSRQLQAAPFPHLSPEGIAKYFPPGTRISRPAGGYMLWIELPPRVDGLKLHRAALLERISILPGVLFSATGRYKNCIRIKPVTSGPRRTTELC